jgi:ABC-type antimicrobial peptide transport system permease subunit
MSLTVTRRRREIGIRAALGARPGRLLATIFSRAAWQLGLGAADGAVFGPALLSGNGMTYESALSLGSVEIIMLVAGLFAAIGPARRGLRIHPMEALREE